MPIAIFAHCAHAVSPLARPCVVFLRRCAVSRARTRLGVWRGKRAQALAWQALNRLLIRGDGLDETVDQGRLLLLAPDEVNIADRQVRQREAAAPVLGDGVAREAERMKHGRTVIAFLQDPDGYKVELIQKGTQYD